MIRHALVDGKLRERGHNTHIALVNLAYGIWLLQGPRPAIEIQHEAADEAARIGVTGEHIDSERTWTHYEVGEWDEVDRLAARVAELEAGALHQPGLNAETMRVQVAAWRGDVAGAAAAIADLLPTARTSPLQAYVPALTTAIHVAHARGDLDEAVAVARELADLQDARDFLNYGFGHPDAMRACIAAGELELAERLVLGMKLTTPHEENASVVCRAILAEARGEIEVARALYEDAAARFHAWPFSIEEALALRGAARCGGDVGAATAILARLGVPEDQTAARKAK